MAGSITVSMKGAQGGVAISIGGGWYARVVDGAREHISNEMAHYIDQIYGAGDASGEDWADLTEVSAEGFNIFYRAIRQSMEMNAKRLFDDAGKSRPTPFGTETDHEIITKLEADSRFDPISVIDSQGTTAADERLARIDRRGNTDACPTTTWSDQND